MNQVFFEAILDNMTDGIYILDDRGNYIFVNSTYVQLLNMPKSTLLTYNVHDFLTTRQIDVCISDIVYKEKRQVVMFQDVYDTQSYGRQTFRQLVVSTPIFNSSGNVQNILACVRPLSTLNALYREASRSQDVLAAAQPDDEEKDPHIVAKSPAMRGILKLAKTVADVDTAVLVTGESGTGKEVVAQYIHRAGKRANKPFVVINCAALPASLLEAELFGYEKGAFTGASASGKKSLFEEASGGTVFLDEINSLPLGLQGVLLRAIETKTIKRIGSNKSIHVDFRLIAASNEDLDELVRQKQFRLDLLYRLNVIPVVIPPLRHRKADIAPLANSFLDYFCDKHSKQLVFSPATLRNMLAYDWPGNVRQLKNFVERSVVVSLEAVIGVDNIAAIAGSSYPSLPTQTSKDYANPSGEFYAQLLVGGVTLEAYLDRCEREYVSYALQQYSTTYKAAAALGTSQTSVMRRKKKYAL
jgi:transcriptional regulator with PAS, ATPase and Fis domain